MIEKYAKKSFTLKEAREILTPLGVVITAQDGEYRVNFKGGKEDTAYYTDDISDAVGTGKMMKKSSTDDGKKTFAQKDLYIGDRGYEGEGEDLGQEYGFLGEGFPDETWGDDENMNPYHPGSEKAKVWNEGFLAGSQHTDAQYDQGYYGKKTFAQKDAKKSFTLKEAREILTPLGVVITAQDGEYRVNFKGGKEDTAYYTDDISDAVGTGKMMKKSSTDDGKKTFAQKDLYIGDRGYEGEGEDLEQEHGFLGQYFWGYGDTKNPYGYNTLEGVPWDEGYEAGFSDASVSMR